MNLGALITALLAANKRPPVTPPPPSYGLIRPETVLTPTSRFVGN